MTEKTGKDDDIILELDLGGEDNDEFGDLDEPLDDEVGVITIDKSKSKLAAKAETTNNYVSRMKSEIVNCDHSWFRSRSGYDRCPKCSNGRLTVKQKQYLYDLWTRRFGIMTKEAATFIDNLSIDEASTAIDKLRRR